MLTVISVRCGGGVAPDRPVRASRAASWAESWRSSLGTRTEPKMKPNLRTPEPADTPDQPRGLKDNRQKPLFIGH